ncbi:MAG: hypothetical protein ACR2PE_01835 [Porticoccus sp.]
MSDGKPKTARSYRGTILNDNAIVSINLKWAFQVLALVAGLVYSYLQVENRIAELERRMELADSQILELVDKNMLEEQKEREVMEERISFFEKELNLNPFSWKKRKKK